MKPNEMLYPILIHLGKKCPGGGGGGGGVESHSHTSMLPTSKMDPKWCIAPCYISTSTK